MEPPTKRQRRGKSPLDRSSGGAGVAEHDDDDDELSFEPSEVRAKHDPHYKLCLERAYADHRFQATMAHIFEKYGRDFEGIGDEIDMFTGEIVVNNGHLDNLRSEGDVGVLLEGDEEGSDDQSVFLEDLLDDDDDEAPSRDTRSIRDRKSQRHREEEEEDEEDRIMHGGKPQSASKPRTSVAKSQALQVKRRSRPSFTNRYPSKASAERAFSSFSASPLAFSTPSPFATEPWRIPGSFRTSPWEPNPMFPRQSPLFPKSFRYELPTQAIGQSIWSPGYRDEEDKADPARALIRARHHGPRGKIRTKTMRRLMPSTMSKSSSAEDIDEEAILTGKKPGHRKVDSNDAVNGSDMDDDLIIPGKASQTEAPSRRGKFSKPDGDGQARKRPGRITESAEEESQEKAAGTLKKSKSLPSKRPQSIAKVTPIDRRRVDSGRTLSTPRSSDGNARKKSESKKSGSQQFTISLPSMSPSRRAAYVIVDVTLEEPSDNQNGFSVEAQKPEEINRDDQVQLSFNPHPPGNDSTETRSKNTKVPQNSQKKSPSIDKEGLRNENDELQRNNGVKPTDGKQRPHSGIDAIDKINRKRLKKPAKRMTKKELDSIYALSDDEMPLRCLPRPIRAPKAPKGAVQKPLSPPSTASVTQDSQSATDDHSSTERMIATKFPPSSSPRHYIPTGDLQHHTDAETPASRSKKPLPKRTAAGLTHELRWLQKGLATLSGAPRSGRQRRSQRVATVASEEDVAAGESEAAVESAEKPEEEHWKESSDAAAATAEERRAAIEHTEEPEDERQEDSSDAAAAAAEDSDLAFENDEEPEEQHLKDSRDVAAAAAEDSDSAFENNEEPTDEHPKDSNDAAADQTIAQPREKEAEYSVPSPKPTARAAVDIDLDELDELTAVVEEEAHPSQQEEDTSKEDSSPSIRVSEPRHATSSPSKPSHPPEPPPSRPTPRPPPPSSSSPSRRPLTKPSPRSLLQTPSRRPSTRPTPSSRRSLLSLLPHADIDDDDDELNLPPRRSIATPPLHSKVWRSTPRTTEVYHTPLRRRLDGPLSPGSAVHTPGGSVRACGVDGFRCGRDFCFTCL